MEKKKVIFSKTMLANLVIAVASAFPAASEWIAANPTAFGLGVSLINMALRQVTGQKVTWAIFEKDL